MIAAKIDAEDAIKTLIKRNKESGNDIVEFLNYKCSLGNTALHFAAGMGSTAATKILLENRADVDAQNLYGETPLYKAVLAAGTMEESLKIIEMLLEKGADLDHKNDNNKTLMDYWRQMDYEHKKRAKFAKGFKQQWTRELVFKIISRPVKDISLVRHPNKLIFWIDPNKLIPSGMNQAIETFLNRPEAANANQVFDSICDAALKPEAKPFIKNVLFAISKVVHINRKDKKRNRTPTMIAAKFDAEEAIEQLIKRNKETLKAVDNKGKIALHFAAYFGNESACEILLKHYDVSEINARTNDGKTAMQCAIDQKHKGCVDLIMKMYGDVGDEEENVSKHPDVKEIDAKTNDGKTTIKCATDKENDENQSNDKQTDMNELD